MAPSTADPIRGKVNNTGLATSRRVRIIGRIRGFTDQETESLSQDSKPWITVCKTQEGPSSENNVRLSFSDQSISRKDAPYKLDYCYEQDADTDTIFSREIKPLISDVLNGGNASIIAYGAKGSGKTYTIQGSQDKPGLAVMSMTELLSKAEEAGKSVSMSILEVHQEHAYDLLDPKYSEVQVLENGRGKIKLKGLSQVSVKSILEFQNIYLNKLKIKPVHKIPLEQPKRSHKCLIMQVSSADDNSHTNLVGKMNFVDLAGYEDAKRSSRDGVALLEGARTMMSLQAVMNVIYALNANEIHVPYRESKLTRIFQESFGGTNHVVMLTCLSPNFCRDTLHTLSLASRSCQSTNHVLTSSTKSDKSSASFNLISSQSQMKPSRTPSTLKKQAGSSVHFSKRKTSCVSKGRNLFDEGKKIDSSQTKPRQDDDSVKELNFKAETPVAVKPASLDDKSISDNALPLVSDRVVSDNKPISETSLDLELVDNALLVESTSDPPPELAPLELVSQDKSIPENPTGLELKENDASANNRKNNLEITPAVICAKSPLEDDGGIGKEKKYLPTNDGPSPPLSARLRELSNNLKSFCSSTPLRVKLAEERNTQLSVQASYVSDITEPKTPTVENGSRVAERLVITKYTSPWERLNNRSSGMKDSLVQEYLKFLNTADKDELKGLKGIGEKRAAYILELREESPEPFKSLDDLQDIRLSAKQVKGMMKKMAGDLFT